MANQKNSKVERRLVGLSNTLLMVDYNPAGATLPQGTLTAEESFTLGGVTYRFLFWTLDGVPTLPDPDAQTVYIPGASRAEPGVCVATKWYTQQGERGDPPTASAVWVPAFSVSKNKFVVASPLATVDPPDNQDGAHVLTQDGPVTLTAQDTLGRTAEPFSHWWWTGHDDAAPAGDPLLTLPQGATGVAIAFYHAPEPRELPALNGSWGYYAEIDPLWLYLKKLAEDLDKPNPPEWAVMAQIAQQATQAETASLAQRVARLEQVRQRPPRP